MEKYKQQQIVVPGAYACSTYICNRVHLVILILFITWLAFLFNVSCLLQFPVLTFLHMLLITRNALANIWIFRRLASLPLAPQNNF